MTGIFSRLLAVCARHTGRHRKQVTEGEIRRAAELLARWKGIGVGEIFR